MGCGLESVIASAKITVPFIPRRAQGLIQNTSLPQPEGPTIEGALHNAPHQIEGAKQRWKLLQKNRATDSELMKGIRREFGEGGSSEHGGWRTKGGNIGDALVEFEKLRGADN